MIVPLAGFRPDNLMTYLAGLGLVRVVHHQLDPEATSWWQGQELMLDTAADDLESFFLDAYRPTPVLSPWNGGSGYGEKDKAPRVALQKLLSTGSPRLADFVTTDAALRRVDQTAAGDKGRYLRRLRNVVPDAALPWIDAAVVLTTDRAKGTVQPVFPPLLGTGGNDGRFDFSTNFHQRLADVLPELGAKRTASASWLRAALRGSSSPLIAATIGQFDPQAAGGPGTSSFDDTPGVTNPWTFVLMVEGLLLFASAPVRRYGEVSSRAAQPFTVNHSPAGPIPGAADEGARGELWAPVWEHPLGGRDVEHLFSSARTSWNGRTATSAAHMYAALRSSGIDRRADRFVRYGLYQRNGLAFSAVRLDTVSAAVEPSIELGIAIERRAEAFLGVPRTQRTTPVCADYETARVSFYRDPSATTLIAFLASATAVEHVTTLTDAGRSEVGITSGRLDAAAALPLLDMVLRTSPEYRIAAGLASGKLTLADDTRCSMADLLLGRTPTHPGVPFREPVVEGFGRHPLATTLTALLTWRVSHAARADGPASAGIALLDNAAVTIPWQDAHLWAQGRLDEATILRGLLAMLALSWSGFTDYAAGPVDVLPSPDLALLQPFARRRVTVGFLDEADRRGILPSWPRLLAAGRSADVLTQAVAILQRASLIVHPATGASLQRPQTRFSRPAATTEPQRLGAALWLPVNSTRALRQITRLSDSSNPDQEVTS